jgi:zinc transporter ZupT
MPWGLASSFWKDSKPKVAGWLAGFASGVMIAASFFRCWPQLNWLKVVL